MSGEPASTIVFTGDSTGAVAALHAVDVEAKRLAESLKTAGKQMENGTTVPPTEPSVRKLSNLSEQIKRLSVEATYGKDSIEAFNRKIEKAGGSPADFKPLLDAYAQVKAAREQANAQFTKSGQLTTELTQGTKAYSAALRQVPAQFTDIVVSLQGGQAPMTVLLQQGGQLKDVFGSAGAAARALGGYVAGLINPFTATAAVVGSLGYAYYAGAEEAKAFQKTLIETGGAAGVTVGQLTNIAASMDALGTTQGRAAETLNTFAAAGVSGAVALERYSLAAIKLSDAGGSAVEDTVKAFASLGKEPLTASLKLNESMNYLTESVYKQIKSLEEQGRHTEAATVAQNAYAQAIESNAPALLANLGLVERAWLGIKNVTKEAWDAAKGIGRTDSLETQAKALSDTIEKYKKNGYNTTNEEAQLAALSKRILLQQDSAQLDKQRADAVKALAQWDKEGVKYLSDKAKIEQEITAARNEGIAAERSKEEIEKRIAAIRASHAKAPKQEGPGFDQEQGKAYAKYIEESNKALLDAQVKTDGLTKSQGALVAMLTDPVFQAMPETWKQTALQAKYAAIAQEQHNIAVEEAEAANNKYVAGLNESAASIEKKLTALGDETKAYSLSIEKNISLAEAIDLVAIARLEEQKAIELSYGDEKAVAAIEREIKARKELAKELRKKADHTAEVEAGKKAAAETLAEWKKGWEETDKLARDAFTAWAENGTSMADAIGKSLKKALLSAIYEATLKPIAFQLYTSIAGGNPAGSALQAASGAGSSVGNISSLLGSAGSLFGAGFKAGIGSVFGEAGIAGGLSAGTTAIGAGNIAGGIGTLAGVAAPLLAGVTALSAVAKAMQYTVEAKGSALVANLGGGSTVVANRNDYQQTGGLFGGGTTNNSDWSAASAETTAYFDAQVKAVTEAARAYGTALGLPVGDLDNFKQQIEVSLTGLNADQAKEAINKAVAGFGDAMVSANFGTAIDAMKKGGETASATLVRVANEVTTVNGTLAMLGGKLLTLDAAGIKAADGLVAAMGGLEAFQQQTASYYESYYSEEEKRLNTAKSIQSELANAGLDVTLEQVLDGTKEQFRALVESFASGGVDLDEEGQKAVAALMKVAGAFAGIAKTPAPKDPGSDKGPSSGNGGGYEKYSPEWYAHGGSGAGSGTSLTWTGGGASESGNSVLSERKSLQDQLDQLIMTDVQLLEKQRNALDESNRALFDQVQAAQKAKQASEERKGLEEQLLQVQGNTAALRELERAKLDETNRALYDQIKALEDAKAVAEERKGLEEQLLQAQGDTVGLRALERAKLDETNRALYDQIKALEDSKAVADEKKSLEEQLLKLQGDTTALRALERAKLDETNRALYDQIKALEDAASVANERKSLEEQLLKAQGDTTALRALEREKLDETNRALYDQIKALEDAAAVTNERKSLEEQLLQAQGDTAALRELEREKLDETNRALYDQIKALEDANKVADEKKSLEEQLLQVQGDTAALRELEREKLDETNRALYDQIKALEDAAAVANERKGLEEQLLQLQGDTTALRELERSKLDETNRALYDQIKALEDANKVLEERKSLEQQLYQATGNTAALRALELAKLDETNRALQLRVWALEDADAAVSKALAGIERAVQAEQERLQKQIENNSKQIEAARETASAFEAIAKSAADGVKSLRQAATDPAVELSKSRAYIDMALSVIRAGGQVNQERLADAIGTVTSDTAEAYASQFDFNFAQLVQAGKLEELSKLADAQKTESERTAEGVESANKLLEAQIDALDDQLQAAKDQVDVMHGIDISVKSVGEAIGELTNAIYNYNAALTGAGGTPTLTEAQKTSQAETYNASLTSGLDMTQVAKDRAKVTALAGLMHDLDGIGAAAAQAAMASGKDWGAAREKAIADAAIAAGYSGDVFSRYHASETSGKQGFDVLEELAKVSSDYLEDIRRMKDYIKPTGASIPAFAVGTNRVPQDMLALLHKDEAVVPAAYNPAVGGNAAGNTGRLEALVEGLTAEVQRLQSIVAEGNDNTRQFADQFDQVSEGGNALRATTV